MRGELVALHRRLKSTMIYVTHDQVEAMTMADQIVVLREGVVEQVGTPIELYARPRKPLRRRLPRRAADEFRRREGRPGGWHARAGAGRWGERCTAPP